MLAWVVVVMLPEVRAITTTDRQNHTSDIKVLYVTAHTKSLRLKKLAMINTREFRV